MAAFPVLKTGAVAQYPLERAVRYSTQTVRFLDGSRQRFRLQGAPLRRWRLNLDLLDDHELASVIAFIDQQTDTPFAFTDPISGETAPKCVLDADTAAASVMGELNGQSSVVIEEVL